MTIDDLRPESSKISMLCHADSLGILPIQWCLKNGVNLTPPKGLYSFLVIFGFTVKDVCLLLLPLKLWWWLLQSISWTISSQSSSLECLGLFWLLSTHEHLSNCVWLVDWCPCASESDSGCTKSSCIPVDGILAILCVCREQKEH